MVNIIEELKNSNKQLLGEIKELKENFGINKNNNLTPAEIRQQLAEALSDMHYTNNPDEKLLDDIIIMTYYPGQNWPKFCENFPVKLGRQIHIECLYKFTMYWKNSFKLHREIDELKHEKQQLTWKNEGLEGEIKNLEKGLEHAKLEASTHLEALDKAEEWKFKQLAHKLISLNLVRKWEIEDKLTTIKNNEELNSKLKEENKNKSDLLTEKQEIIEGKDKEIERLRNELKTERELLADARKTMEEKDELIRLSNKPLPKLPSKFKVFKEKIRTNLQHLAEKTKHQSQKLFARIEVRN